jgi:phosphonate transport system substrate-binding protein
MVLAALLMAGCGQASEERPLRYSAAPETGAAPVYRLAVHPLHNPTKLGEAYQPLIDQLNRQQLGAQFELEASRDYPSFENKYRQREPDFLLPNPWQTLDAMKHGYQVIAMAGEAQDFRGIILVRRDSPVLQPADLKGRVVSYPSPTALAAAIMPQYYLHSHGLDVQRDIQNRYVGSQESSIMHVYLGQSAAGATWPPPWRLFQRDHPAEAAQLRVIWETEPLLNNSVMARDDVPPALREALRRSLLELAQSAPGPAILRGMANAGFYAANDASYAPVRAYIERFEREVRRVESP